MLLSAGKKMLLQILMLSSPLTLIIAIAPPLPVAGAQIVLSDFIILQMYKT
jgi:hypothetical protein